MVQHHHRQRTADNVQVVDPSILASLSDRHRITKGGVKFNQLTIAERKQFYHEAVQEILAFVSRNLIANAGAYRVASAYNIRIVTCARGRIKLSVNNRLEAARALIGHVNSLASSETVATPTAT
jgi:hypothetical protein